MRGPRTAMKSGPHLPQLEKALAQKRRPNTAKKKKKQKAFYLSHTEDYSPEATFPDYSEQVLQRSMLFSTVLYLIKTKNMK